MKIGIISDTHGFIHPKIFDFFAECDEVWHAGDMVSTDILDQLSAITKIRAVYGNCDGWEVFEKYKEIEVFECEEHTVFLKHIVGNPKNYNSDVLQLIKKAKPSIVVAGHSHILQIINDAQNGWLFMNPGGGGKFGPHTRITFIRFDIKGTDISNVEVFDTEK
jgi:putative phosphoesterase